MNNLSDKSSHVYTVRLTDNLHQIVYPHTILEQSQQGNIKIQNQGKKNFMDFFQATRSLDFFF